MANYPLIPTSSTSACLAAATFYCASAEQQEQWGEALGRLSLIHKPLGIFLHGELGAGKTTLVRGVLHGLGYSGRVKSPTYSLLEKYELAGQQIVHADLYRLRDPEEIFAFGLLDELQTADLWLIEWPEKAASLLPTADLYCYIAAFAEGRQLQWEARTMNGKVLLAALENA